LMQLRPEGWRNAGGKICFPWGSVERGEARMKAAIRETYEEAGVVTNKHKLKYVRGGVWTAKWEDCKVKKATTGGEVQPAHRLQAKIPGAVKGPNKHCWLSLSQIEKNMKRFAWNHGKIAVELLKGLLKRQGASVQRKPSRLATHLLKRKSASGMEELLRLAKKRRWDRILTQLPTEGVDERNGHSYTLLHHAAEQGQVKAVEALIKLNADPNLTVRGKSITAKDLARIGGRTDVLTLLG